MRWQRKRLYRLVSVYDVLVQGKLSITSNADEEGKRHDSAYARRLADYSNDDIITIAVDYRHDRISYLDE